jgi:hypothetical protein
MSDIHIDEFYKDVAKIFLFLYLQFPKPVLIYVEDISGADVPDEFGLHSPRHNACFSAMLWMADSGYLRYVDTVRQEALDQAVLTQKSFTLLTAKSELPHQHPKIRDETLPPSVIEEYSSNIHQIRLALKSTSSVQIRQVVRYLLEESRRH